MPKIRVIASLCCLLLLVSSAASINVAAATATYNWYFDYALSPLLPLTVRSIACASKEICAYFCTATANCFAATLVSTNKTCLLLVNCGHVVLVKSNNTVTITISTMPSIISSSPIINLPLVMECNGYFNQLGYGSLSLVKTNQASKWSNYSTGISTSPTIPSNTCLPDALALTGYMLFQDTLSHSFDLFSSGGSFSVSFMIRPVCTLFNQNIFGFSTSETDPNCFMAMLDNSSYPVIKVGYFPSCNGWDAVTGLVPEATFSFPIYLNNYHHVTAVYDSVGKTFTGYMNGTASVAQSVNLTNTSAVVNGMKIGNSRTLSYSYGGAIFCLQLYKSALSQSEIRSLNQFCLSGGILLK